MQLPTLVKTWQFSPNNAVSAGASTLATQQKLLHAIITTLKGFGTNPWTVDHSCDSVTAGTRHDGVERCTTDAKFVWTGSGSAPDGTGVRSWEVLQNVGGAQICISCEGVSSATPSIYLGAYGSPSGGFGGARTGTTSLRPKASDEFTMRNSSSTTSGNWVVNSSANNSYVYHVWHSTDGLATYVAICVTGKCVGFWALGTPVSTQAGWSSPFAGMLYGCNSSSTADAPLYANIFAAAKGAANIGGVAAALFWSTDGFGTQAIGQQVTGADSVSGAFVMSPIGLCSTTASAIGKHGVMPDIWYGSTTPVTGDRYPSGSNEFVQFGNVILPWDLSTPNTGTGGGTTNRDGELVAGAASSAPPPPSMVPGSCTVAADGSGNITISGTGFAKGYADTANPGISPSAILAMKAAINDNTAFQAALDSIYITRANALAYIISYIQANAAVSGSSVT